MAVSKVTHSRRKRKRNAFPEIKGKIVEGVEIMPGENGYSIGIMFQDRTFLSFDVEPYLTVSPELSDWKSKNYRPLKRWQTVTSR
jgi:hypothetical protein